MTEYQEYYSLLDCKASYSKGRSQEEAKTSAYRVLRECLQCAYTRLNNRTRGVVSSGFEIGLL